MNSARHAGLFITCVILTTFGSYFAYDSFTGLAPLLKSDWGFSSEMTARALMFLSVGSAVAALTSGLYVDQFGAVGAYLLTMIIIMLGVTGCALGANLGGHHALLFLGRLLFGFGIEALIVAQNVLIQARLPARRQGMAFGGLNAVARLGSLMTLNLEPFLGRRYGLPLAFWVVTVPCGLGLLTVFAYWWRDKGQDAPTDASTSADSEPPDKVTVGGGIQGAPTDSRTSGDTHVEWTRLLLLIAVCLVFYSAFLPFTSLSANFFHEVWGLHETTDTPQTILDALRVAFLPDLSTAPGVTSLYAIIGLSSLVMGWFLDRNQRPVLMMTTGLTIMVVCYLILGCSLPASPILSMILLSLAFVLVSTPIWPSVKGLVGEGRLGVANGIIGVTQNLGIALFGWLFGVISSPSDVPPSEQVQRWQWGMVMFAVLSFSGVVLCYALSEIRIDTRTGTDARRPELASA